MKSLKHWQDLANLAIGIWLFVCTWVFGWQAEVPIAANFIAVGGLLVAVALGAAVAPREWEEWVEVALALWLMASPWALGFAANRNATLNAVAAGVAIAILSLWVLLTDPDYKGSNDVLKMR